MTHIYGTDYRFLMILRSNMTLYDLILAQRRPFEALEIPISVGSIWIYHI